MWSILASVVMCLPADQDDSVLRSWHLIGTHVAIMRLARNQETFEAAKGQVERLLREVINKHPHSALGRFLRVGLRP